MSDISPDLVLQLEIRQKIWMTLQSYEIFWTTPNIFQTFFEKIISAVNPRVCEVPTFMGQSGKIRKTPPDHPSQGEEQEPEPVSTESLPLKGEVR